MTRLDWPALMRVGLRGLGLQPDVFWALTPAELQTMLGDPSKSGPLLSTRLEALMASYPDTEDEDDGNDG
ncbi:rcc01693 family protein [uncultured Roseobacter sp.]|uniref:rcc01693 family protein n=1 Tax=uncultured Roseobacter sp. TaxID=114847 RepID=UPI0026175C10|nr:rcc01693 family protein [uncultured Roseobacter sp.]